MRNSRISSRKRKNSRTVFGLFLRGPDKASLTKRGRKSCDTFPLKSFWREQRNPSLTWDSDVILDFCCITFWVLLSQAPIARHKIVRPLFTTSVTASLYNCNIQPQILMSLSHVQPLFTSSVTVSLYNYTVLCIQSLVLICVSHIQPLFTSSVTVSLYNYTIQPLLAIRTATTAGEVSE